MTPDESSLLDVFTSTWDDITPNDLPLLDVFTSLREQYDLLLGIEEYLLVLRALRAGIGWKSRQDLQQLCCMLWAKSEDEVRLVCLVMDRVLSERDSQMQAPTVSQESSTSSEPLAEKDASLPEPASKTILAAHDAIQEGGEPAQVVQAIRRSSHEVLEISRFQLITEYFPVTQRQMKQSWRHIQRKIREGPLEELDVEATVKKIAGEGVLLEPVLLPRRVNQAELVLLVDQGGSMVPFHSLSRQLIETAQRGSQLGQTVVYYFHDYPAKFLYTDPARLEGKALGDVLAKFSIRTAVLIISDAGAARGKFDTRRITHTENFILQLKQVVHYYAWLNPMPNFRWIHTTAGAIARLIPMFEMSRQGLDAAISTLRGRYVYWEKSYPWMM